MSDKRRKESRIYSKLRKEFLENNPYCQFGICHVAATDIHHTMLRGKNYLNVESFMALCREHHSFIHAHPNKAREMGLLK